jgi:hypothetical protein
VAVAVSFDVGLAAFSESINKQAISTKLRSSCIPYYLKETMCQGPTEGVVEDNRFSFTDAWKRIPEAYRQKHGRRARTARISSNWSTLS